MRTISSKSVAIDTIAGGLYLALISTTMVASSQMTRSGFRNDMRKLWEDHITWTRLYLVSAAANLPDKDPTAHRRR